MITASDSALNYLQQLQQSSPDSAITLSVESGGCSGFNYVWDMQPSNSASLLANFEKVLLSPQVTIWIDTMCESLLSGSHLDFETSLAGNRLVFKNPQARAKCGCGKSFGV